MLAYCTAIALLDGIGIVCTYTAASASATQFAEYCNKQKSFCLSAQLDVPSSEVTFTLQSTAKGWAAFGIGSSMVGASLYVAYNDGNGGVTVSQRVAKAYEMPTLAPSQEFTILSNTPDYITRLAGGKILVSFSRPVTGSSSSSPISTDSPQKFIYAFSETPPEDPNNPAADIEEHTINGFFKLNFVASATSTSSSSSKITATVTETPLSTSSTMSMSATGSPTSSVSPISSFCDITNSLCVSAIPNPSTNEVIFTLQSTAQGWAAFGIGSKMSDATMYMAYNNGNGDVTLSQRSTTRHLPPSLSSRQEFVIVDTPASVTRLSGAQISVSFKRGVSGSTSSNALSLDDTAPPTVFIFAFGDDAPMNPADPASTVPKHTSDGSFAMRLVGSGSSIATQLPDDENSDDKDKKKKDTPTTAPNTSPDGSLVTSSYCDDKKIVCIYAQRDVKNGVATFTLQSVAQGWAGFGIGSKMSDSTMYIAYNNGNGGVTLSQRSTTGHTMPMLSAAQEFTIAKTPLSALSLSGATISVSFNRTMTGSASSSAISTTGHISFIYAYGDQVPAEPLNPSSSIAEHTSYGSFSMSLDGVDALPGSQPSPTGDINPGRGGSNSVGNTAIAKFCDSPSFFCVTAVHDLDSSVVSYTITSRAKGWVGFGIGESVMAGSTFYIACKDPLIGNSTSNLGNVILSQRQSASKGHAEPIVAPEQEFILLSAPLPLVRDIDSAANLIVSFNRSLTAGVFSNAVSAKGPTKHIFAYSTDPPSAGSFSSSSSPLSADIGIHDQYGIFILDVSQAGDSSGNMDDDDKARKRMLVLSHGAFMFLGWGVFPFIGIFTARYLKTVLGHNWFRIHLVCAVGGTLLCTFLGILCVELSLEPDEVMRFEPHGHDGGNKAHRPLGAVIVLGVMPLQMVFGYVSNAVWSVNRTSVPWWDKAHWWLGRSAVVLAAVEMYLGLALYKASLVLVVLYWVWIVLNVVVLVFGQMRYGQVHHVALKEGSEDQVELK